jgi:hypothetical protein
LIVPAIFLLSVAVALVSAELAYLAWFLAFPVLAALRRRFPHDTAGAPDEYA